MPPITSLRLAKIFLVTAAVATSLHLTTTVRLLNERKGLEEALEKKISILDNLRKERGV
ncbi:hypothetical protein IFR05_012281 [Cadophora sp. M221]|nr:hypothetical protein IFR05_012281 [Cadophora sp. M221]